MDAGKRVLPESSLAAILKGKMWLDDAGFQVMNQVSITEILCSQDLQFPLRCLNWITVTGNAQQD